MNDNPVKKPGGRGLHRRFALLLLWVLSGVASAQETRLPFEGRWFVMQGGDTLNVNQHMQAKSQWYGIDFAKVGGASMRELAKGNAARIEDFYSWGQPVRSPVEGTIVEVASDLPDHALGTKDGVHAFGNYAVIEARKDRFVVLAHMQRGTVSVKVGEHVAIGASVGRCGNSGNSDFPHIHMHVQDRRELDAGTGQNVVFSHMNVELNGKSFADVTWPLIRGLFVEPL